jgi:hypothetical protein
MVFVARVFGCLAQVLLQVDNRKVIGSQFAGYFEALVERIIVYDDYLELTGRVILF